MRPILLTPANWVRTRIWMSKLPNQEVTNALHVMSRNFRNQPANIGHATLETKNIYASIWPDWHFAINQIGAGSQFATSPKADERAEGSPADYIIDFYSLDSKAIEDMFKKLFLVAEGEKVPKDGQRVVGPQLPWTLLGDKLSVGYSCSSLTLALLEAGGMHMLLSQNARKLISPSSLFVISPNNLVNQLLLAKEVENIRYPEVKEFEPPVVTEPGNLHQTSYLVNMKARAIINLDKLQEEDTTNTPKQKY